MKSLGRVAALIAFACALDARADALDQLLSDAKKTEKDVQVSDFSRASKSTVCARCGKSPQELCDPAHPETVPYPAKLMVSQTAQGPLFTRCLPKGELAQAGIRPEHGFDDCEFMAWDERKRGYTFGVINYKEVDGRQVPQVERLDGARQSACMNCHGNLPIFPQQPWTAMNGKAGAEPGQPNGSLKGTYEYYGYVPEDLPGPTLPTQLQRKDSTRKIPAYLQLPSAPNQLDCSQGLKEYDDAVRLGARMVQAQRACAKICTGGSPLEQRRCQAFLIAVGLDQLAGGEAQRRVGQFTLAGSFDAVSPTFRKDKLQAPIDAAMQDFDKRYAAFQEGKGVRPFDFTNFKNYLATTLERSRDLESAFCQETSILADGTAEQTLLCQRGGSARDSVLLEATGTSRLIGNRCGYEARKKELSEGGSVQPALNRDGTCWLPRKADGKLKADEAAYAAVAVARDCLGRTFGEDKETLELLQRNRDRLTPVAISEIAVRVANAGTAGKSCESASALVAELLGQRFPSESYLQAKRREAGRDVPAAPPSGSKACLKGDQVRKVLASCAGCHGTAGANPALLFGNRSTPSRITLTTEDAQGNTVEERARYFGSMPQEFLALFEGAPSTLAAQRKAIVAEIARKKGVPPEKLAANERSMELFGDSYLEDSDLSRFHMRVRHAPGWREFQVAQRALEKLESGAPSVEVCDEYTSGQRTTDVTGYLADANPKPACTPTVPLDVNRVTPLQQPGAGSTLKPGL